MREIVQRFRNVEVYAVVNSPEEERELADRETQERAAAEEAERLRWDEQKQKLAAIKERQGKKETTLDDVLELLLLVAEKVGVGSTNG